MGSFSLTAGQCRKAVAPAQAGAGLNRQIQLSDGLIKVNDKEKNMRQAAVYIMTNKRNGTLYIGVTGNLMQRVWQHKQGFGIFTSEHGLYSLAWYELHEDISATITREKQLKKWKRDWKLRLIEEINPDWKDLWPQIIA